VVEVLEERRLDVSYSPAALGDTMKRIMRNLRVEDVDKVEIDFYWGEAVIETSKEGFDGFYYKTYRLNIDENRLEIIVSILDDIKRRPIYAVEMTLEDEETEEILKFIRRYVKNHLQRVKTLKP